MPLTTLFIQIIMPWVHGQPYMEQKNAELRNLLILRQLPHSGNKEQMVSRLVAHDRNQSVQRSTATLPNTEYLLIKNHSPFPFKKLPAELRNQVYKLVSISGHYFESQNPQPPSFGHTEGARCFESLQSITDHSALFRACKQTRTEGLAIFYQYHVFGISVEHSGCFIAINRWLDNIGYIGRQNIRDLRIHFGGKCIAEDICWMSEIHTRLSDQATVVYFPKRAKSLWKIGRRYYRKNPQKVPLFKIHGLETMPELLQWADKETRDYANPPLWRELAPHNHRLLYSMQFKPGGGWFGQPPDDDLF